MEVKCLQPLLGLIPSMVMILLVQVISITPLTESIKFRRPQRQGMTSANWKDNAVLEKTPIGSRSKLE